MTNLKMSINHKNLLATFDVVISDLIIYMLSQQSITVPLQRMQALSTLLYFCMISAFKVSASVKYAVLILQVSLLQFTLSMRTVILIIVHTRAVHVHQFFFSSPTIDS
jgi:hypothetical protein